MRSLAVLALASLLGCGSLPNDAPDGGGRDVATEPLQCNYANTDVVAYQDCKQTTSAGFACVEGCGRLPDDGGLGTLLPTGCTVQIGTSKPVTGLCVSSCSECN